VQALGPHVAPLGVLYWPAEDEVPADASTGATQQQQEEWPEEYGGSVFVGEHGCDSAAAATVFRGRCLLLPRRCWQSLLLLLLCTCTFRCCLGCRDRLGLPAQLL
jgi:hypothetical protein